MITATDIMRLRGMTQMPVSVCKSALEEAQGDIEKAKEIIRQKTGAVPVTPTQGAHGVIAIYEGKNYISIVELNTQTDFASRSSLVISQANEIARRCADEPLEITGGVLSSIVQEMTMQVGEQISVARHAIFSQHSPYKISTYLHHDRSIGVILRTNPNQDMESEDSDVLRKICMHIAAVIPSPVVISADQMSPEMMESERRYLETKALTSGKPPEIQQRIVQGGLVKYANDRALLEQPFVVDPKVKVGSLLNKSSVVEFVRWQVGENVEVILD